VLPAFFRLALAGKAARGCNVGHLDDWSASAGGVKVNAFT
jgi:hypothetical protein